MKGFEKRKKATAELASWPQCAGSFQEEEAGGEKSGPREARRRKGPRRPDKWAKLKKKEPTKDQAKKEVEAAEKKKARQAETRQEKESRLKEVRPQKASK